MLLHGLRSGSTGLVFSCYLYSLLLRNTSSGLCQKEAGLQHFPPVYPLILLKALSYLFKGYQWSRSWGMLGSVVDKVHSIYEYLGSLPSIVKQNGTSHPWLLLSME